MSDSYVLFVKVEDRICNQASLSIRLEKPDHKVVITNWELPQELTCTDRLETAITMKNQGKEKEDATITLESKILGINATTDPFQLEKKDTKVTKKVKFDLPNTQTGKYPLTLSVKYGNEITTIQKNVSVTCSQAETNVQQYPLDIEHLNVEQSLVKKQDPLWSVIILFIVLNTLVIGSIIIVRASQESKENQFVDVRKPLSRPESKSTLTRNSKKL